MRRTLSHSPDGFLLQDQCLSDTQTPSSKSPDANCPGDSSNTNIPQPLLDESSNADHPQNNTSQPQPLSQSPPRNPAPTPPPQNITPESLQPQDKTTPVAKTPQKPAPRPPQSTPQTTESQQYPAPLPRSHSKRKLYSNRVGMVADMHRSHISRGAESTLGKCFIS